MDFHGNQNKEELTNYSEKIYIDGTKLSYIRESSDVNIPNHINSD